MGIFQWTAGADAKAIVAAPGCHHQYRPDLVFAEPGALTVEEQAELERRGHGVRAWPATIGNMQRRHLGPRHRQGGCPPRSALGRRRSSALRISLDSRDLRGAADRAGGDHGVRRNGCPCPCSTGRSRNVRGRSCSSSAQPRSPRPSCSRSCCRPAPRPFGHRHGAWPVERVPVAARAADRGAPGAVPREGSRRRQVRAVCRPRSNSRAATTPS